MRRLFLGKPVHWLLWLIAVAVLFALGRAKLHVFAFNGFIAVVLALALACVIVIIATSRPGEAITRDPFDRD